MAVRKKPKPLLYIISAIILVVIIAICTLSYLKSPVDKKDSNAIEVVIPAGSSTKQIASILKEKKLIKSNVYFEVYVRVIKKATLKASTYSLNKSMSVEKIVTVLSEGNSYNPAEIKLTFKEGKRLTDYVGIIANSTNHSQEEIENTLKSPDYLKQLIQKYWFLTDEILNSNIYYPLEGYLFPDTYYFANKDVKITEIIEKILDQTAKVLEQYKTSIESSSLSTHEIITLASIIEKEGKSTDFRNISSVFYNRLAISMKLQSCATAYYGMGMDFTDVGIATSEMINNKNPYNTYNITGLPVGPISMPGSNAINAAVNPASTKNLFFISDNEGKTYFFETAEEHAKKKAELIKAGKWER